ncbi:hypothetical protein [Mycetocola zhujimingii]|uniref:Uncharacterized protein n=1 Tax=Mycetocola zhujimingii TaxID=2079792 RepID=A0A2U1TGZ4_9MICO|nr:hypothetical protein [Mycetocola zhujimingii]PWC08157.1 hypothetical protein DF223_02040 [Mycetocola zhujimingii]
MPIDFTISQNAYFVIVAAILIALTVVFIRLILAATRALNAYADDRKLRTAMALDDLDEVPESQSNGVTATSKR